ncbi:hypothetical protein KKC63_00780 [Patescibacteria group bacterium]|nr:hypothetical protein [Patescibacteria group bacterium]MBU4022899.1 hypothetical protein [Patescibacteria group bacterium]MBU4078497.1 hypothetical protein [Patescibacteria group bacterium]
MIRVIEDRVIEIIGELADPAGKPCNSTMLKDLSINGPQVDVLVEYIEEEFGIKIPERSIQSNTIVEAVCEKVVELVCPEDR